MLMLMEDKEYLLLRGSARSHHVLTRGFSAISSMTGLATAASKWKKSISMKSTSKVAGLQGIVFVHSNVPRLANILGLRFEMLSRGSLVFMDAMC